MILVTFRESDSLLTSMFTTPFSSVEEAKKFIKEDAMHYIKVHKLNKITSLVNVIATDHFEVRNEYGSTILIYQYFEVN